MQNEKYLELDALAAPNGYVVSPTNPKPIRTNATSWSIWKRKPFCRNVLDFAAD